MVLLISCFLSLIQISLIYFVFLSGAIVTRFHFLSFTFILFNCLFLYLSFVIFLIVDLYWLSQFIISTIYVFFCCVFLLIPFLSVWYPFGFSLTFVEISFMIFFSVISYVCLFILSILYLMVYVIFLFIFAPNFIIVDCVGWLNSSCMVRSAFNAA